MEVTEQAWAPGARAGLAALPMSKRVPWAPASWGELRGHAPHPSAPSSRKAVAPREAAAVVVLESGPEHSALSGRLGPLLGLAPFSCAQTEP